jgi:hypothetical protein
MNILIACEYFWFIVNINRARAIAQVLRLPRVRTHVSQQKKDISGTWTFEMSPRLKETLPRRGLEMKAQYTTPVHIDSIWMTRVCGLSL